ncbi:hypothetical protein HJG60_010785 [Phyllostomus discolor]|uniref:Uncharacterized protein n=1 Tax=Phyllostomus discolor TaxID=89673 RepID=A0A834A6P0_9CHIR|nr:hypothetical protein HJG60_010785 [Phyllostomus discolor]
MRVGHEFGGHTNAPSTTPVWGQWHSHSADPHLAAGKRFWRELPRFVHCCKKQARKPQPGVCVLSASASPHTRVTSSVPNDHGRCPLQSLLRCLWHLPPLPHHAAGCPRLPASLQWSALARQIQPTGLGMQGPSQLTFASPAAQHPLPKCPAFESRSQLFQTTPGPHRLRSSAHGLSSLQCPTLLGGGGRRASGPRERRQWNLRAGNQLPGAPWSRHVNFPWAPLPKSKTSPSSHPVYDGPNPTCRVNSLRAWS